MNLRWGRIIIGAVLLEVALFAILVPLFSVLDSPLNGTPDPSKSYALFYAIVCGTVLVAGVVTGWLVARRLPASQVPNAAAAGILATVIYLGLCSIPPGTIAKAAASYGILWFVALNGLRIVGAAVGGWFQQSKTPQAAVTVN